MEGEGVGEKEKGKRRRRGWEISLPRSLLEVGACE